MLDRAVVVQVLKLGLEDPDFCHELFSCEPIIKHEAGERISGFARVFNNAGVREREVDLALQFSHGFLTSPIASWCTRKRDGGGASVSRRLKSRRGLHYCTTHFNLRGFLRLRLLPSLRLLSQWGLIARSAEPVARFANAHAGPGSCSERGTQTGVVLISVHHRNRTGACLS